jgi:ABC-2 type transport system permease protein
VWQLLAIIVLAPLMCLAGGAMAMIVLGFVRSNKTANIVVMLITLPQMFLSGVVIPIGHSTGILFILSRLMPMTYCIDLARSVVYAGTPEYSEVVLFNPVINLAAIITLTVVFLVVGTYFFARGEKNR